MKYFYSIFFSVLLLCVGVDASYAQTYGADVRKGNKDYKKGRYAEASSHYQNAIGLDSLSLTANFNNANALYKQGEHAEAIQCLERSASVVEGTEYEAAYYYNLGTYNIAAKDWQAAVDALKKSLILDPANLDAKENYIYARKHLQDQQQQDQQGQDEQDQDQNQDQQGQDEQDQDQNQDQQGQDEQDQDQNQDQQGQDQQDQQQDKDEQGEPQGQQDKLTPQAAQQILDALQAKEKETKKKVDEKKADVYKSRQRGKNW